MSSMYTYILLIVTIFGWISSSHELLRPHQFTLRFIFPTDEVSKGHGNVDRAPMRPRVFPSVHPPVWTSVNGASGDYRKKYCLTGFVTCYIDLCSTSFDRCWLSSSLDNFWPSGGQIRVCKWTFHTLVSDWSQPVSYQMIKDVSDPVTPI